MVKNWPRKPCGHVFISHEEKSSVSLNPKTEEQISPRRVSPGERPTLNNRTEEFGIQVETERHAMNTIETQARLSKTFCEEFKNKFFFQFGGKIRMKFIRSQKG